jgi:hypothetical protein
MTVYCTLLSVHETPSTASYDMDWERAGGSAATTYLRNITKTASPLS